MWFLKTVTARWSDLKLAIQAKSMPASLVLWVAPAPTGSPDIQLCLITWAAVCATNGSESSNCRVNEKYSTQSRWIQNCKKSGAQIPTVLSRLSQCNITRPVRLRKQREEYISVNGDVITINRDIFSYYVVFRNISTSVTRNTKRLQARFLESTRKKGKETPSLGWGNSCGSAFRV